MSAASWLMVWLTLAGASVVAHEAGHVLAGVRLGWEYRGWFVKLRYCAVGVNLEPNGNERHLWRVALAGPVTTAGVAGVFACAAQAPGVAGQVFSSLMWLNLSLLTINLLPTPVTDGGLVLRGLRAR